MDKIKNDIIMELKNVIAASETRILSKIETINEKAIRLEEENTELKGKVEYMERQLKKNNLVAFGLVKKPEEVAVDNICNKLNALLELNITTNDISDLYLIGGTTGKEPLKIELTSKFTKVNILRNCIKLKGKNITIAHDLTRSQQEKNKVLVKHLKEIRSKGRDKCYIKGEKLYINNKPYTAEEITKKEEEIGESGGVWDEDEEEGEPEKKKEEITLRTRKQSASDRQQKKVVTIKKK